MLEADETKNSTYPEICQNIPPLNIFSSQSDLPVSMLLIILKVSQWYLKDSVFESFWSNLLRDKAEVILYAQTHKHLENIKYIKVSRLWKKYSLGSMASAFHQKEWLQVRARNLTPQKTIGSKAAYQLPLPNPSKVGDFCIGYTLFFINNKINATKQSLQSH